MKSYYPMPDCEFDIEGEDVFSVERVKSLEKIRIFGKNEYSEKTVITFYEKTNKQKLQTWYLECSPNKHAEFVSRFRRKLGREFTAN
jgi:hypothetical protein